MFLRFACYKFTWIKFILLSVQHAWNRRPPNIPKVCKEAWALMLCDIPQYIKIINTRVCCDPRYIHIHTHKHTWSVVRRAYSIYDSSHWQLGHFTLRWDYRMPSFPHFITCVPFEWQQNYFQTIKVTLLVYSKHYLGCFWTRGNMFVISKNMGLIPCSVVIPASDIFEGDKVWLVIWLE